MSPALRRFWLVLLGLAAFASRELQATNRALLVGVARYPALADNPLVPVLRGPTNDVLLMRSVLEKHGFAPKAIRTLSQIAGAPEPTRANILQAWDALVSDAASGDQIVILLCGHGTRQPSRREFANDEPDGLDEVFLPSDAGNWSDGSHAIVNGLTDQEIHERIRRLGARGAFVWFIADCCHSGSMTRGSPQGGGAVSRGIPANALIPESVLEEARRSSQAGHSARRAGGERSPHDAAPELPGGWVAMSACEPDERTIELPLSGRPDEYHGLFTYHLAQVISRVRRPLTYLELLEQVRADYRARHLVSPSPQADGPDQNRLVLGGAESIGRQPFFLHREPHGTKLRVSGGRLMGLTPGAVLEVFPQPTQSGASASRAHVCVVTSDLLTSEVRPSAFGRNPAPKPSQLIDGSWCEVVTPGPIDFRLKVGLREAPARGEPSPDSRPASRPAVALEDLWRGLAQHREVEGRWVRTIEPVQADWILTWNPDVTGRSEWVLSAGWLSWPLPDADSAANTMAFRFLPTPGSPPTSCLDEIADAFRRISRASGFLRLVQATVPRHREGEGLDFKLGLHLLPRVADEDGGTRQAGTHVRVLRPGDLVSISLTNSGPIRFEAVIFCVDSAYGITQLPLRSPGALLPGESTATPPLEIDSWPLGPEQIVALVYRWAPQRSLDFSGIDQPPIRTNAVVGGSGEVHRNPLDRREFSRRGAKGESLASLTPLAEWLRMAGDTRLNRAGQELSASDYAIQCLSYRVEARRADSGSGRRRD